MNAVAEKSEPASVTKAAYARHTGLSKARVTQLTKPGALLATAVTAEGQIDLVKADELRTQYLDGAKANVKLPLDGPTGAGEAEPDGELQSSTAVGLADARLRREELAIRSGEVELEVKLGKLVDKAALMQDVSERLQLVFEQVRTAGITLSERLAHDELIESEAGDEVQAALADELGKIVEDVKATWNAEDA